MRSVESLSPDERMDLLMVGLLSGRAYEVVETLLREQETAWDTIQRMQCPKSGSGTGCTGLPCVEYTILERGNYLLQLSFPTFKHVYASDGLNTDETEKAPIAGRLKIMPSLCSLNESQIRIMLNGGTEEEERQMMQHTLHVLPEEATEELYRKFLVDIHRRIRLFQEVADEAHYWFLMKQPRPDRVLSDIHSEIHTQG